MLKILNVGQNNISNIGNEITNLKKLEVLYIYNNLFTKMPVKLKNLTNLNELGLDWFRYTKPPIDTLIYRPLQNQIFSKLAELCTTYSKTSKTDISFKDFIQHFSLNEIELTKIDSRGRNVAFLSAESEELGILKAILAENGQNINL